MNDSTDPTARRDALLEATLPNVMFDGWSMVALRAGAASLGVGMDEIALIFPDGPDEAASWLDDWADRKMLAALEAMDLAAMKTRERVEAGVVARLDILAPHREAVRRAIARKFGPFGAAETGRAVYRTVDAIWYAAGDDATDFNFYTKRGLLAAVYAPTMLYWLNDGSEDAADTRAFLSRRLADVMKLPKLIGRLKDMARPRSACFGEKSTKPI